MRNDCCELWDNGCTECPTPIAPRTAHSSTCPVAHPDPTRVRVTFPPTQGPPPTVGRLVHCFWTDDAESEPQAALITAVDHDDVVCVALFEIDGLRFLTGVPFDQPSTERGDHHYCWRWPARVG